MSAPFFNPFRNWGFSSTSSFNSPPALDCGCDDVIDGKHYRTDNQICSLETFAQVQAPSRRYEPAVSNTIGSINKPISSQSSAEQVSKAVESLKAISFKASVTSRLAQTAPPTTTVATVVHTEDKENANTGSAPQFKDTATTGAPLLKPTSSTSTPQEQAHQQLEQKAHNNGVSEYGTASSTSSGQQSSESVSQSSVSSSVAPPMVPASQKFWSKSAHLQSIFTPLSPVPEDAALPIKDPNGKAREYSTWHAHSTGSRVPQAPYQSVDTTMENPGLSPIIPKAEGKMVLGCSQCLFSPKVRVIPCECSICLECCGRFCTSVTTNAIVYCGCGERVCSVVNMPEPPRAASNRYQYNTGQYTPASGFVTTPRTPSSYRPGFASPTSTVYPYSPHTMYSPQTPYSPYSPYTTWNEGATTNAYHAQGLVASAQMAGIGQSLLGSPSNIACMIRMLSMDADTAIRSAPFIELGTQGIRQAWSCVKIGNIPYNVTTDELFNFLGAQSNLAPESAGSIGVHVIMDRSTGKTMDAYAEFLTAEDAWKCVSRRRSRVLGNRHLTLEVVDQSELMKDIFPRAKGIIWEGFAPKREYLEDNGSKIEILNREELTQIVNHAKTPHRSPFSRKCLPRPFQSLMSIVSKFPWFATDLYTIAQRDYIFYALWTAIDILKRSIKRGRTTPNLDVDLLKALLGVGIRCAGFTDAQKYELVKTAEFGADGVQVDDDIGILSGFEALGKAVGTERRVLEFYSFLLELSLLPFIGGASSQALQTAELLRAKVLTRGHPEESKKSYLTMNETAAMEWSTLEMAIRMVLTSRQSSLNSKNTNRASSGGWRDQPPPY